jgi:chaperonin GroEL
MQNIFNYTDNINITAIMEQVSNLVGSTLGPNGKYNVINFPGKGVHTTKDGVTCLRFLSSQDPFVNGILTIIKEASENTLKKAGDGTTSTVLIANEMLKALKGEDIKPTKLKEKVKYMVEAIPSITQNVDDKTMYDVIYTSVSGDKELANLLYKAYTYSDMGHNISVFTELGQKSNVQVIEGVSFNAIPASEAFNRQKVTMDNPLIVAYSGTIESEREVVEFIELAKKEGYKDIIVLSTAYTEEALSVFSINHAQNVINVLPLVVTGGQAIQNKDLVYIISKAIGAPMLGQEFASYLYDIDFNNLKMPKKVLFDKKNITVEGITVEQPDELIKKYTNKLNNSKNDEEMNINSFILSILKRKMVKIVLGAHVENKLTELKDRVDDALHSIKNAFKYGVVEGAGYSYITLNNKTTTPELFKDIFSVITKRIGEIDRTHNVYDSVKVVEYVLKSSLELALLLNNIYGTMVITNKK